MHKTCGCDESKALRAALVELREAAFPVLAWVDRSVGGDAAHKLEVALAATEHLAPTPSASTRCHAPGRYGITCELPAGHGGEHRCCQIGWA